MTEIIYPTQRQINLFSHNSVVPLLEVAADDDFLLDLSRLKDIGYIWTRHSKESAKIIVASRNVGRLRLPQEFESIPLDKHGQKEHGYIQHELETYFVFGQGDRVSRLSGHWENYMPPHAPDRSKLVLTTIYNNLRAA